jgi:FolB domain-containing protein
VSTCATLSLDQLELQVHLGWTEAERQEPQLVLVSIEINFIDMPEGCIDDELDNTLCYDKLSQLLVKLVADKHFKLLEFLAKSLFDAVQGSLSKGDRLTLEVSKKPPMENLQRASFSLSDTRGC